MTDEAIEKVLEIALESVKPFYRKQILDYINRLKNEREQAEKVTAKKIITYLSKFEGYANIASEELAEQYGIEAEE